MGLIIFFSQLYPAHQSSGLSSYHPRMLIEPFRGRIL
ncbi:uncharacterized protein METZ01_LOCUS82538 [marine metagenome]|uniref:Uncharacterized protein n=1 Tax=marine metagenome TaxID=408172 RepID=A0A381UNX7_9ZZZZ